MTNQSAVPKLTKYIRVTGDLNAKFVEFDFAIHDPTLYVELVLPQDAFQKFCQTNEVVEMEEEKWRYGTEVTLVGAQRYSLDHEDQSK